MQLQDWGELAKTLRDLFRRFRDLPMNVILVAQEAYLTDEDKIKKVVPSLNGKAATEISYFMDIVGYINVKADGTRWVETATNKKLLTKDRSGLIGNDAPMDFAEWEKLIKKMNTGEQKVQVDYSTPTPKAATGATPHLINLKQELKKLGATDAKSALKTINTLLGEKFKDLKFSEPDSSKLLMMLLQLPKVTVEENGDVVVDNAKVKGKVKTKKATK